MEGVGQFFLLLTAERRAMAAQWYYQIMGQQFGPVSAAELRALASAGTVARDTLI